MKKFKSITSLLIVGLTMVLLIGCANDTAKPANSSNQQVEEIKSMSGEELVKQNTGKEKDKVLIIDVRSPEEYRAGHIPNAINMNIDGFKDRLGELENLKEFPIITYCNTGNKSGQAAEILVNNGFKDVTNAAGVKEYQYELVKYEEISGAAFQKFINENKDIVLVDVRPEKQVKEEGMIQGAVNVPFDTVEEHLSQLPKDKTIALYCNTGTKSAEVAKKLEGLGYEKIVNSIEGVKEYPFSLSK